MQTYFQQSITDKGVPQGTVTRLAAEVAQELHAARVTLGEHGDEQSIHEIAWDMAIARAMVWDDAAAWQWRRERQSLKDDLKDEAAFWRQVAGVIEGLRQTLEVA